MEIINAPGGLPFLKSNGGAGANPIMSTTAVPPKADIVVEGKGGGAESGGEYDSAADLEGN